MSKDSTVATLTVNEDIQVGSAEEVECDSDANEQTFLDLQHSIIDNQGLESYELSKGDISSTNNPSDGLLIPHDDREAISLQVKDNVEIGISKLENNLRVDEPLGANFPNTNDVERDSLAKDISTPDGLLDSSYDEAYCKPSEIDNLVAKNESRPCGENSVSRMKSPVMVDENEDPDMVTDTIPCHKNGINGDTQSLIQENNTDDNMSQISDSESEIFNVQSQTAEEVHSQQDKLAHDEGTLEVAIGADVVIADELSASREELLGIILKLNSEMRLVEENNRLKYESHLMETERSAASSQKQMEFLSKQLIDAKDSFTGKDQELERTKAVLTQENIAVRTQLTDRLEQLMTRCQSSIREKDSMVMKYAISENDVLKLKKQREGLEKKMKEQQRDKELLQCKLKSLAVDKSKISNALDSKIQEYTLASREFERLKEEANAKDVKIKWGQTKHRLELDAHKETQSRLDKALDKITKHQEEMQTMKREAEKIVHDSSENESSRANSLDKQLREQKALVITERQKKEDFAAFLKSTTSELETLKSVYFTLENDSSVLREKIIKYEQEREVGEKLFSSLQTEVISARQGAADLSNKLSTSSATAELLEREQLKVDTLEEKARALESNLEEESIELSQCRAKEAELLSFTQKLTDQNVKLQGQFTSLEEKIRLLEVEKEETRTELIEAQRQTSSLRKKLNSLLTSKFEETESLATELTAKTDEVDNLKTKVSDLYNEIKVQQKKHQNANKDINREIVKLRKRLEFFENERHLLQNEDNSEERGGDDRSNCYSTEYSTHSSHSESPSSSSTIPPHDSLSHSSRAFSSSSLNAIDGHTVNGRLHKGISSSEGGLSTDILVERIIRLQKEVMKKSEKIDFLEEHVSQLISELKKKNKIIHHYIMKEESGVVSNSKSDSAKAEIIKRGGIMASVYGSTPKDGAMTLDLSLAINKKLQAVLEDTLLKNITLKENLNTLGDEVANLSLQNSRLHLKKN